ncbi:MAG: hypothetical protein V3R79_01665 [Alphaproteobacteria bacterium]
MAVSRVFHCNVLGVEFGAAADEFAGRRRPIPLPGVSIFLPN